MGFGMDCGVGGRKQRMFGKDFRPSGSTGTMAWADPATRTLCVVLTSLPAHAVQPHPRDLVAAAIAAATA